MTDRLPSTDTTDRTRGRRWIARIGALLAMLVLAPILALVSPADAHHEDDGHTTYCDAGKTPDFSFRDDMENPASGNWTFGKTQGPVNWSYKAKWDPGFDTGSDTPKGTTSLVAQDREVITDSTATRTGTITPASGTPTYVRFTHLAHFLWHPDGVVVEYNVNGGPWKNVTDKNTGATLFDQNPYTEIIEEDEYFPGPLTGQHGWTQNQYDLKWEVSRLNLGTLAGHSVGIRFRHGSNIDGDDTEYAFLLDDYSVYTCVPLARVNAPTNVTATAGNRSATVSWTPPTTQGNLPITGYLVTPFKNGVAVPGGEQWLDEAETSTSFTALQNGANYSFTVAAEVEGGMGPTSAASNTVVPKLPATSGSLVYIKNNNVWLSGPYGENPRQLTTDGTPTVPYASPSQNDDGNTIVAVRNENVTSTGEHKRGRVFVMDRHGALRTSFVPPNQWEPAAGNGGCAGFEVTADGINTVAISPDGTGLVYSAQASVFRSQSEFPFCRRDYLGRTFVSQPDGSNPMQLVANDGKSDFRYPSWVANTRLIMRFGQQRHSWMPPSEEEAALYSHSTGGAVSLWFKSLGASEDGLASFDPVQRGTKLADVNDTVLQAWATNGGPPAAPTRKCVVREGHGNNGFDGKFSRPTWSPDAAVLAWTEKADVADAPSEGIYVSPVGNIAAEEGCPSHDTSQLVIQGGSDPYWGPAPHGGGSGTARRPYDFDGDAKADQGVFRPSTGTWFVRKSAGGDSILPYGTAGDIAVTADYDGDAKADHGVFRPSSGTWFIRKSTGGDMALSYGTSGDIPVSADYDGDAKADVGVFRPSSGVWFIRKSTGGDMGLAYGTNGDIPVPADYDGDAKADVGVFRSGVWFVRKSTGGDTVVAYGANGDIPVTADYDGDAKADHGVFRPSSGLWFVRKTTGGETIVGYGTTGDVPTPLPAALKMAFFS